MAAAAAVAAQRPFYMQKTDVKVDYTDVTGKATSVDLPLITLPAGTVLFRAMKIPNPATGEDFRTFYRDYLGNPETITSSQKATGVKGFCLSPLHNVFFYPFPYIAFGAHTVGATFTMMQISVLVHPITVVCAMSPSDFVRGRALRYDGDAPWQRCSNFSGPGVECHLRTGEERKALSYDNCLRPEFQASSGVRGWMAVADRDSLNPVVEVDGRKRAVISKTVPMSVNMLSLSKTNPKEAVKLVASTYMDSQGHAGFPEIAMYPYKAHKGPGNIKRSCATNEFAMRILEKEAATDNLNFLPIAAFTKNGVIDMVGGHFNYEALKPSPNAFVAEGSQQVINQAMQGYMEKMEREGVTLPYYGKCMLKYDTRTGFYVLDGIVGNFKPSSPAQVPLYKELLLPLASPGQKDYAMQYMLAIRSYYPEQFMQMYPVGEKAAKKFMRHSFVFKRFPFIKALFTELGMPLPSALYESWKVSARIQGDYEKKYKPKAAAAPAAKAPVAAKAPAVAAAEQLASIRAPAQEELPDYGGIGDGTPRTPAFGTPRTPAFGTPRTPAFGTPKEESKGGRRITKRSKKSNSRKTRSVAPVKDLATFFTRLWKAHAKKKV